MTTPIEKKYIENGLILQTAYNAFLNKQLIYID